jgi:hypothetical protein
MTAPPAVALELHCAGYARMSLTPAGHDALAAVRACARTLLGQHDLAVLAGTAAGPGVPYAALPPLPPVISAAAMPVLAAYERHAAAAARAVLARHRAQHRFTASRAAAGRDARDRLGPPAPIRPG